MDIDMYLPCPECGAQLWVPIRMAVTLENTMQDLWLDEDEFQAALQRHVELNPDLHPAAPPDGNHPADLR